MTRGSLYASKHPSCEPHRLQTLLSLSKEDHSLTARLGDSLPDQQPRANRPKLLAALLTSPTSQPTRPAFPTTRKSSVVPLLLFWSCTSLRRPPLVPLLLPLPLRRRGRRRLPSPSPTRRRIAARGNSQTPSQNIIIETGATQAQAQQQAHDDDSFLPLRQELANGRVLAAAATAVSRDVGLA